MNVRDYVRSILVGDDELDRGAAHVLATLALYVNARTGTTWVGVSTLAKATRLHHCNVRRHLATLTRAGIIAAQPRPGRSTVYRLPIQGVLDIEVVHTPRATAQGQTEEPCAPPRTTLRATAHHPARQRATERVKERVKKDAADCTLCDGSGWITVGDRLVDHCPSCTTAVAT